MEDKKNYNFNLMNKSLNKKPNLFRSWENVIDSNYELNNMPIVRRYEHCNFDIMYL